MLRSLFYVLPRNALGSIVSNRLLSNSKSPRRTVLKLKEAVKIERILFLSMSTSTNCGMSEIWSGTRVSPFSDKTKSEIGLTPGRKKELRMLLIFASSKFWLQQQSLIRPVSAPLTSVQVHGAKSASGGQTMRPRTDATNSKAASYISFQHF